MRDLLGRLAGLLGSKSDGLDFDLSREGLAERTLAQITREAVAAMGTGYQIKLAGLPSWEKLKTAGDQLQIAVLLAAMAKKKEDATSFLHRADWRLDHVNSAIVSQLFRKKLPYTEAQLVMLLEPIEQLYSLRYGHFVPPFLNPVERYAKEHSSLGRLRPLLGKIQDHILGDSLGEHLNKQSREIIGRIGNLLDPPPAAAGPALPEGAFADWLRQWLGAEVGADNREAWLTLSSFAATSGDKAQPSSKWLSDAKPLIAAVGETAVMEFIVAALDKTVPDPEYPDDSLDILKGLLWITVLLDHGNLAGPVGRFAQRCFRKVTGFGARSVKLGNAALWALSEMAEEPGAAAELFRLRSAIKYPSVQATIEKRLAEFAGNKGDVSLADLEDASLPDFDLDEEGRAKFEFGDAWADVGVSAVDVSVHWTNAGGKRVKSAPAVVREAHKAEYKAFRQHIKDIGAARAAQSTRLEQGWLEDRRWTFDAWKKTHLDHPLRGQLVKALIWRIEDNGAGYSAMPNGKALHGLDGRSVTPAADAIVRLWHPLDSNPEEVQAWRRHLLEREITQPIKQAYREIYVLTDAERATRIYSNRFAAHILRQHQFRALCQARGWRYDFQGDWDSSNTPLRPLPNGIMVQYLVEPIADDQLNGIWMHVATDQVRFVDRTWEPVELETLAPVLFSECMRDVDLFVAVTSIANDPEWSDGGPEGRHGQYWRHWAFGELGQSAQARRELIAAIVPKLAIADRLEVGDKSLLVQGRRHRYAIHFGSSNIQILPSNRYLCIVPDPGRKLAEKIRLPFAGDNLLSIILSKAFLLADEEQITDPTILAQL